MRPRSSFEKKFGKYAINNLSMILILCYACGYLLQWIFPYFLTYLTLNPYEILFHGQIWRLVTWLVVPPSGFSFFTLLMLYFYYTIGTTLERTWGAYRYNVYIFSGFLFTILGAFLLYGTTVVVYGDAYGGNAAVLWATTSGYGNLSILFSTYYVNMSIFLAFAATFPNLQVMLFFLIPLKVKVLGIIYAILLLYQFITGTFVIRFVIGASLLNFVIFFFTSRGHIHMSPKQVKRRTEFKRDVKRASNVTRHKCAVCGRTEETNPELQFRFCSKCDGNYEYCEEHIFTHTHVKL